MAAQPDQLQLLRGEGLLQEPQARTAFAPPRAFRPADPVCLAHSPVVGFSNKKDGQDVRVHGTFGANAIPIDKALNAPRLDTVNEQVRGANTKLS